MPYEYIVSACLAGQNCKYNGGSNPCGEVLELYRQGLALPVCPETLAGLKQPREPAERQGKSIVSRCGADLTRKFAEGAERALAIAKASGVKRAILKSRSPSCGYGSIYDGSFTGCICNGNGIWAQKLLDSGFKLFTEESLPDEIRETF